MSLLVHFLPCGLLCPHCITLFASLPCESNADDRTLEVIRNPPAMQVVIYEDMFGPRFPAEVVHTKKNRADGNGTPKVV